MFERTPQLAEVIKAQLAAEKLEVQGVGTFNVEWHLGGDLKTIKWFLGCKQGENSLLPCPFCMRGYKPSLRKQGKWSQGMATPMQVEEGADDMASREWEASVLRCPMLAELDRASNDI